MVNVRAQGNGECIGGGDVKARQDRCRRRVHVE
jgi:hypothetical protein